MAKIAKSSLVIVFDQETGFEITFRGQWSRRMLDQIQKKLYKQLRAHKHEIRRKEDERRTEESGREES